MYGTQPIPPSASEICRFGNRCSLPENSKSTVVHIRLVANRVVATAKGASGTVSCPGTGFTVEKEKPGTKEPEPKCSDTGIWASEQTCHNRSQWSLWKEGRPSGTGLSGKDTVRAPFAATRSASAIVASMSHTGRMANGT